MNITLLFINLIFLIILPFLMLGIIKKTKAFWGGRKGASIFQPFFDFIKLLKKESVISENTTMLFKMAPIISLVTILIASLFIPMLNGQSLFNVDCAFIIFSYVMGFGKFFSIIAAMDTGSSFEGMGASREACFSTLVEPAFFIMLGSICIFTKDMSFNSFSLLTSFGHTYSFLIMLLAIIGLFIMMLIEGCRVPVDDPNTHLELTMIHEVMILDNSGIDLALITWSSMIKMFLFSTLIINLILPSNLSLLTTAILYPLLIVLISILVGTVESAMARFRMIHVFEFIFIMTPIALVVLSIVAIKMYGGIS